MQAVPTHTDSLSDEEFAWYERELPGELRAAGAAFPGPSADLVARGLARGRQRRRARTVRRTALAVVLVLASVGGWAGIDGTFDTSSGPADRTGDLRAVPAPRDLLPFLAKAVPPGGGLTDGVTRFEVDSPRVLRTEASVSATYTNQNGSSALTVVLTRPVLGSRADLEDVPACDKASAQDECTRSAEPDGGSLVVRRTATTAEKTEQELRVVHTRPDGARVDVRLGGRYLVPGDIAVAPVLSVEQVTAAARSDAWKSVLAAIPTVSQQVAGLVTSLMPAGARVVSADGAPGAGEFVVDSDDSHGERTHVLKVSVEAGPADERPTCPAKADRACEVVKLSDGTMARIDRMRFGDGSFGPPVLTAFRPHGLRVGFEQGVPSEKAWGARGSILWPAESMVLEQAKAIAASSRWDAF